MAELNLEESTGRRSGVGRMKKADLRIDMTPMVDLGFLLIAFFIFTTEISKPMITKLFMPHAGDSTKIPESKSLTILLGNNNRVFYYSGTEEIAIKNKHVFQTTYDELTGLGSAIRLKQAELEKRKTDKSELIVLIKPGRESSYKNVLDALDEMLINVVANTQLLSPESKNQAS